MDSRTFSNKSEKRYGYLTCQDFWHFEIFFSFIFQDTTLLGSLWFASL